jgi:hypothetical protein
MRSPGRGGAAWPSLIERDIETDRGSTSTAVGRQESDEGAEHTDYQP